jgi:hypothetical protein
MKIRRNGKKTDILSNVQYKHTVHRCGDKNTSFLALRITRPPRFCSGQDGFRIYPNELTMRFTAAFSPLAGQENPNIAKRYY